MLRAAINPMLMREKKSAIINVGSATSYFLKAKGGSFPYEMYHFYAATKAYRAELSRILRAAYGQMIDLIDDIPLDQHLIDEDP